MSSPQMMTMLGFCCCCAVDGALTKAAAATDCDRTKQDVPNLTHNLDLSWLGNALYFVMRKVEWMNACYGLIIVQSGRLTARTDANAPAQDCLGSRAEISP